jgi:hypothetical protein
LQFLSFAVHFVFSDTRLDRLTKEALGLAASTAAKSNESVVALLDPSDQVEDVLNRERLEG